MENNENVFNFIEVCAGGGGLSCGLEKSGLKPILLNDIDKYRVTIEMRLTRIFLPVHFSIKPTMIRYCLAKIFNEGV